MKNKKRGQAALPDCLLFMLSPKTQSIYCSPSSIDSREEWLTPLFMTSAICQKMIDFRFIFGGFSE